MIHRVTGEVNFRDGLHIIPHCSIHTLTVSAEGLRRIKTQRLSHTQWKRHILGVHASTHGTFEVEALSADDDRVLVVMLAHQHVFYEATTPDDAERRAFHDGVVSSDLAGQQEFIWGEVFHRLERAANKSWLGIAYRLEANVPLPSREALSSLYARENLPEENP